MLDRIKLSFILPEVLKVKQTFLEYFSISFFPRLFFFFIHFTFAFSVYIKMLDSFSVVECSS